MRDLPVDLRNEAECIVYISDCIHDKFNWCHIITVLIVNGQKYTVYCVGDWH